MSLAANLAKSARVVLGTMAAKNAAASGDMPAGTVLQSVASSTGAVSTSVVVMPLDDTIPQITEGAELLTATITPSAATNVLDVEVVLNLSNNTGVTNVAALFRDSVADAVCAGAVSGMGIAGVMTQLTLRYRVAAGSTAATTFSVRAGPSSTVTMTVNGSAGARLLGGVMLSSLTVTEIKS